MQASCAVDGFLRAGEHPSGLRSKSRSLGCYIHAAVWLKEPTHPLPSRHRNFNEASPTSPPHGDTQPVHQGIHPMTV